MLRREDNLLETEKINLKGFISKYLKYWYLFVASVILFIGIAYVYLLYTTPQYAISSTLLIRESKKQGGIPTVDGAFSELDIFQTDKNISNEIEVLKAKTLMPRVLKELSLHTSYYVPGTFRPIELYGASLPLKVIVSKLDDSAYTKEITLILKGSNNFILKDAKSETAYKFGQEIKKPYGVFTIVASSESPVQDQKELIIKFNNIEKLAKHYNSKLVVGPVNKDASVLSIAITDAVPERGKDIVNKLVEVYNKEAVEDKNLMASNTLKFIDERLEFLTSELSSTEKDVEQYKRQNEVTDVTSDAKISLSEASENKKQLTDWSIQIAVLQEIEKYLGKQNGRYELVPSNLTIQDPTLLGLINNFNNLQMERQRLLRTVQPDNPLVLNLNEQLTNLQGNILENIRTIKTGLILTRNNLLAQSAQFQSRIRQVPSIERDLIDINRQQGIKQQLYSYLLQKREESTLALAATISNSRVIDSAISTDEPVLPKRQLIYVLAFLLGIGFPFAILYIKDLLNDKIQELKDIELTTSAPILGEINRSTSKEKLVVTKDSRSPAAESFRLIRANLRYARIGKENKVILVTSSMSKEGKTFFSINLGASLALTGKRVVVLDFDLRKSGSLKSLGSSNGKGITNYLNAEVSAVDEILVASPFVEDLYIIESGPYSFNPAELMLLPAVGELIEELKEKFDYIIIDSSPVGLVADAFAFAPYIDSSIYLTRYNHTFKGQVNIIEDIHKNKKLKNLMVVLNDAKKENGYGYGYGYGDEQINKGKNRKAAKV